jgi:hypothetical protein
MATSYADYLIENGATKEEVTVLDTPAARRAYDKLQAQVAEAAQEKRKVADLVERNREWAQQVEMQNAEYLKQRDSAQIEVAKAAAAFQKMQDLGLIEIAERMEPGSVQPRAGETPAFDPKLLEKYVDRDTLMAVAEREGDAIATAQDISFEHAQLFGSDPAKRLNFRELRKEAVSRKMPVESLWMERYGVSAAREAAAAKAQAAHEAKIAAEAVTKYKSEHPETNPMLAVPQVSRTPFTNALPSATAGVKQPWQKSDAEKEQSRVGKAIKHLEELGLAQA